MGSERRTREGSGDVPGTYRERRELLRGRWRQQRGEQRQPAQLWRQHGDAVGDPGRQALHAPLRPGTRWGSGERASARGRAAWLELLRRPAATGGDRTAAPAALRPALPELCGRPCCCQIAPASRILPSRPLRPPARRSPPSAPPPSATAPAQGPPGAQGCEVDGEGYQDRQARGSAVSTPSCT